MQILRKICTPGAHADENRKKQTNKDKKTTGALYKLSQRSERGR